MHFLTNPLALLIRRATKKYGKEGRKQTTTLSYGHWKGFLAPHPVIDAKAPA